MKIILLVLLFIYRVNCASSTIVYICDSPNARKYHYKENCRGLSNCNYKIIETTLEKSEKANKTLCRWEQGRPKNS